MAYRTDSLRLQDGRKAIDAISLPDPETLEGLEAQFRLVMDGALALQSLDDLGSKEANDAAWNDMLRLQEKGDELRAKISELKHNQ